MPTGLPRVGGVVQAPTINFDWGLAMGLGVPRFAARRFFPGPAGLSRMRSFTRRTLARWGLNAYADDVAIVANELLINTVLHSNSVEPGWLGLLDTPHTLMCAVTDYSVEAPARGEPHPLAEGGRGLVIVDALSETWGWTSRGDTGKTTWAHLPKA